MNELLFKYLENDGKFFSDYKGKHVQSLCQNFVVEFFKSLVYYNILRGIHFDV